jgi:hypothetical protein
MSASNSVRQRTKISVRLVVLALLSLLIILTLTTATFSNPPQTSFAQNSTSFVNAFGSLVKKANTLSQSYHNATEKAGKDNKTVIAITDSYQPKYQSLIKEAKSLQPPQQFQNATSLYTKSLESELQSNNHLRNALATNNSTQNKMSSKLLSDSFNYEIEAFKKLKASGLFMVVP